MAARPKQVSRSPRRAEAVLRRFVDGARRA
jgi:hypothetical protein